MGEMPRDLSEEAVARWLHGENHTYIRDTLGEWGRTWDAASPDERTGEEVRNVYRNLARAVRSLVEQKVREAVREGYSLGMQNAVEDESGTVSRVLGDHPQGGHEAQGRGGA